MHLGFSFVLRGARGGPLRASETKLHLFFSPPSTRGIPTRGTGRRRWNGIPKTQRRSPSILVGDDQNQIENLDELRTRRHTRATFTNTHNIHRANTAVLSLLSAGIPTSPNIRVYTHLDASLFYLFHIKISNFSVISSRYVESQVCTNSMNICAHLCLYIS